LTFFWTDTRLRTPTLIEGREITLNTSEAFDENCLEELGSEWDEYSLSSVYIRAMLNNIMHGNIPISPGPHANSPFTEVWSQLPGPEQRQAFVQAANANLRTFYSRHPPTGERPAVTFISLRKSCHVLAVLRDEWESLLHLDQWVLPSPETMAQLFPNLVMPGTQELMDRLFSEKSTAYDFDEAMLCPLGVVPPQHIVVAVITFDHNSSSSYLPRSSTQSSHAREFADAETRKRARSIASNASSTEQMSKPRRVRSSSSRIPLTQAHPETRSGEATAHPSLNHDHTKHHLYSPSRDTQELLSLEYFRGLLCGSPNRSWASGAVVGNNKMCLLSFDREGITKSAPIDIQSVEGSELFHDWILALGSRTMEQWGFTNLFGLIRKRIEEAEVDIPGTNLHLSFGPLRYRQHGIFGRCTNVYDVTIRIGDEVIDGVCKIAWPASTRSNESELITKARAVDPVHIPEVHHTEDVATELPSRKLRIQCGATSSVEPRTMRVTVMTRYRPIDELKGLEFLDVFTQIMRCTLFSLSLITSHFPLPGNMRLVEARSVHHRDLSPTNMMYYRDGEGQAIGVLTDFDLAAPLDEPVGIPSHQSRQGTAPFMPWALLQDADIEHTLTHDYESALYILVWVSMGYKGWNPPSEAGDPLRAWTKGSWDSIASEKLGFLAGTYYDVDIADKVRPEYQCLVKPIEALRHLIQMNHLLDNLKYPRSSVENSVPHLTTSVFFDVLKV
jgi:Fungal protein kinase